MRKHDRLTLTATKLYKTPQSTNNLDRFVTQEESSVAGGGKDFALRNNDALGDVSEKLYKVKIPVLIQGESTLTNVWNPMETTIWLTLYSRTRQSEWEALNTWVALKK
jgi:hypothetical protein